MIIAFDVMGFENKIEEAIIAATDFCKHFIDTKIILVGNQEIIKSKIKLNKHFEIVHANDFIKMDDTPILALRKETTSMHIAIKLVKDKKANAVVSAGSTSCFVPLVRTILGVINDIPKFGFMSYIPSTNKIGFNMLDVGANIYVDGSDLYNFALMANEYVKIIRKIPKPKIGVLNIGTERHKGFKYHLECDQLMRANKDLNYIGYIEPKNLLNGEVDICVCDGFSGNICLKSLEGALTTVSKIIKQNSIKPWNWIGTIFYVPVIKLLTKTFDYRNNAAAIVLGANGIAIKTHGSADNKQFYSALKMAHDCVKKNLLHNIKKINYE